MQAILRQGKSSLYSYTRTSETRTVEDDDPETEDIVETREETWYIYPLSYNGESYFADTVFHLADDQKALAGDYAQNLSLFLGDGMFQYTEYGGTTIASLGNVRFTDGATEVVYFNQLDERWANKPYGTDNIGGLLVLYSVSRPANVSTASGPGYRPMCRLDAANWIRFRPFRQVGILQDIFSVVVHTLHAPGDDTGLDPSNIQ